MPRRIAAACAAAALVTTGAVALSSAPAAAEPVSFGDARAELEGNVDKIVLDSMARDFDMSRSEVYDRLAVDKVAVDVEEIAESEFGDAYAGTWVDADGAGATVAVSDAGLADRIAELGATAAIVDDTLSDLDSSFNALVDVADTPEGIHSWYVDVAANAVTIAAADENAAKEFADAAGVDYAEVVYEHSAEQARPLYDIRGGDAYYPGSSRCSVGFAINHAGGSGFVTAGHCGSAGTSVSGYNQVALGSVQAATFPSADRAWVAANGNWTSVPRVNGYGQQDFTVADGNEAPSGASVCRSGSTTGVHCGTLGQKNQCVTYPQGTVCGMTRTNVCAEPGDSGGSWISGGSAQGVTSGGSGNCSSGGTTYFYPLTPILNAYPVTLTTSGNGGEPPGGCDESAENFAGSLSGTGGYSYEPDGDYYYAGAGAHVGCLSGPSGADFDLYLWRWNGSSWQSVASSESPTSEEEISYNGSAGYYVWRVESYSGSGSYEFGLTRP
ncbi:MAG: S1 family peptidase [Stackebrandtia sp.]